MAKTYATLFPLVIEEIEKRTGAAVISTSSRFTVQPGGEGGSLDSRAISEMIAAIVSDLSDIIGAKIISGLDVTATTPPSASINIAAGTATSHGKKWTLSDAATIKIPLDSSTYLFFVTIYNDNIDITRTYDSTRCELCRIVIPRPGATAAIVDDKPTDGLDGYIVSAKDIVYKEDQEFDDASVEKLRDVIGDILADNLIGNIRLSENLKIINTQGTLELDSASVKIKDVNASVLAKFDRNGTFFYDTSNRIIAKFGSDEAYVGNILVTKNSIETRNFVANSTGFQIKDNGDVEFNNAIFRGTIYATSGSITGDVSVGGILAAESGLIGGWTITSSNLYATTTGTIKTSLNVGAGYNGVILDKDGIRVYDDVLGEVVNLPSDGSAPTFSSGVIEETTFEIQTNAVLRTSETVGDGTANSAGLLINNTGLYGCAASQTLSSANFKILTSGNAYFNGEIYSNSGQIGGVVINENGLFGGLIEGSLIRSPIIESSSGYPKIRLDNLGFYYLVTPSVGQYNSFAYGDGTVYGSGALAYLFRENYPVLSIISEQNAADIRLYNRTIDPAAGTHAIGDLICVDAALKICTVAGTPGTFVEIGLPTGATRALDNLLNVAINSSLISDTDATDDLGSSGVQWKDLYVNGKAYIDGIGENCLVDLDVELEFGDTAVHVSSQDDAHLDLTADTNIDFNIVSTEQINLTDGKLNPTTDNDIDLGDSTHEFKDLRIDGLAYIDQLGETIDFNDQQATNFIIENRTDDTGMSVTGQIWFRTDI